MSTNQSRPWTYGDTIDGIFVMPDPDRRGEFISEVRPGIVRGFSAPYWVVQRNWGWLGDVLVEFECGRKNWQSLTPR